MLCHFTTDIIQHYVIKFVSDLRQVGGFIWVLRFPPPIKLTATKQLKYCFLWKLRYQMFVRKLRCRNNLHQVRSKPNNLKILGSKKIKKHQQNSHKRLRSPLSLTTSISVFVDLAWSIFILGRGNTLNFEVICKAIEEYQVPRNSVLSKYCYFL
jgi:hypothetical protein